MSPGSKKRKRKRRKTADTTIPQLPNMSEESESDISPIISVVKEHQAIDHQLKDVKNQLSQLVANASKQSLQNDAEQTNDINKEEYPSSVTSESSSLLDASSTEKSDTMVSSSIPTSNPTHMISTHIVDESESTVNNNCNVPDTNTTEGLSFTDAQIKELLCLIEKITNLEERWSVVDDTLSKLLKNFNDSDQYSRLNSLILEKLCNVPDYHDERFCDYVADQLNRLIPGLRRPITYEDFDDCHVLPSKSKAGSPVVIVKFVRKRLRNYIYSTRNFVSKYVRITEHLTTSNLQLFNKAKRAYGVDNVWSLKGIVYANIEGSKHTIKKLSDIPNDIVHDNKGGDIHIHRNKRLVKSNASAYHSNNRNVINQNATLNSYNPPNHTNYTSRTYYGSQPHFSGENSNNYYYDFPQISNNQWFQNNDGYNTHYLYPSRGGNYSNYRGSIQRVRENYGGYRRNW